MVLGRPGGYWLRARRLGAGRRVGSPGAVGGGSMTVPTPHTGRVGGMAGKFEVYADSRGQFRFRLKAGNRKIIAASGAYASKDGALNGIESVRRNAADAEVSDLT